MKRFFSFKICMKHNEVEVILSLHASYFCFIGPEINAEKNL